MCFQPNVRKWLGRIYSSKGTQTQKEGFKANVRVKSSDLQYQPRLWRRPWRAGLGQADGMGGSGWSGCKASLLICDDSLLSLSSRGGTAEEMWAMTWETGVGMDKPTGWPVLVLKSDFSCILALTFISFVFVGKLLTWLLSLSLLICKMWVRGPLTAPGAVMRLSVWCPQHSAPHALTPQWRVAVGSWEAGLLPGNTSTEEDWLAKELAKLGSGWFYCLH